MLGRVLVADGLDPLGPVLGLTREQVIRKFAFGSVDEVGDKGCDRGCATEYRRDPGEERREDSGLEFILGLTREQVVRQFASGLGEAGDKRCNRGSSGERGEDQWKDPGLEFLSLGLKLTFGLVEEGD